MNRLAWRLLLLSLPCLCHVSLAVAQSTADMKNIRFVTIDSAARIPLEGVTCRVLTVSGKFYKYGVSAKGGHLALSVNRADLLEFSYIGYTKKKIKAVDVSAIKENVVEMSADDVVLREVRVEVPPITARGDTLIYNVASFRSAGDLHLEDVLRKLPGVHVSENGTVSVQGKAINKFYIEGMDLMGGSYGTATKNMPIDAVKSIEVLENHQPVKMLHGKAFSDKAALNIKLGDAHKSRPFGEARAGAGVAPPVWDARIFMAQVAKNNQLLLSAKTNRAGEDLSSETEEHIDAMDIDAYMALPRNILVSKSSQEELPKSRYTENESYSSGFNYLLRLTNNSTFRANIRLYDDRSTENSSLDCLYGGLATIRITETRQTKRKTLAVLPVLRYELNSRRIYITDELRYSFNRVANMGGLEANESNINEYAYSRSGYVQNYFNSSFFVGGSVVRMKSLTRYFCRKDHLDVQSDSLYCYNVAERLATRSLATRNTLSSAFQLFGNQFEFGLRVFYHNSHYGYHAENTCYEKLTASFLPSYSIKYGINSHVSLRLPIVYTDATLTLSGDKRKRDFVSFSPEIEVSHQFSDMFKIGLSASMNAEDAPSPFFSNDTLRTGYRTLFVSANEIFRNTSRRITLHLRYRDYVSMFFASLTASYSRMRRESYTNYEYTGLFSTSAETVGRNRRQTLIVDADADKSFASMGLSLKAEASYNRMTFLLSQNSVLSQNVSNVVSASLAATFQRLKWMKVIVRSRGNLYWEHCGMGSSTALSSLATNMSVSVFPAGNLEMKLKIENITNEVSDSHYKSHTFLDGSLRYVINKAWEMALTATNILNVRSYTAVTNSGLNHFNSALSLVGRRWMFCLLVRF